MTLFKLNLSSSLPNLMGSCRLFAAIDKRRQNIHSLDMPQWLNVIIDLPSGVSFKILKLPQISNTGQNKWKYTMRKTIGAATRSADNQK